jgi:signal transduction histidine kinase/DNA-binding response OmpR family regulator
MRALVPSAFNPEFEIVIAGGDLAGLGELVASNRAAAIQTDVESNADIAAQRLAAGTQQLLLVDADTLPEPAAWISRIRASHPDRIIVVTGTAPSAELLIQLLHAGVDDFVTKPYSVRDVTSRIRFLCQRKLVTDAHAQVLQRLKNTSTLLDESQVDLSREIVRTNQALQGLNQTLKKHVSQLTILYQMGRDISDNENWSEALDRFLMALVNYMQADGAALLLFSDEERHLAMRSNFQVDSDAIAKGCRVLLETWRKNPRGAEIHSIESYEDRVFKTCLERVKSWRYTVIPLRHRNRPLGFLLIDKEYRSGLSFKAEYHFLNTIQTIMGEEVANASYISELRQLGRFNQKVLDTINSGVVTTNMDGEVQFYNRQAALLCPALSDGARSHFDDVFYSDKFGDGFFNRLIASGKDTHVLEVIGRRRGDEHFPARLRATKMHDDNLNGMVLVAIFEDLSDQKLLEAEVRRNDRLRVLGQLSAGVAHEIRNPLTGIATSAEVLGSKIQGDEDKMKYIHAILDEIHRLDGIIRNLLNFARPAKPQMGMCSLPEVSDRVLGLLSDEAQKKGVRLDVDNRLTYEACKADSDQLTQVMLNIVLNSIQACGTGNTVKIQLKNAADGDRLERRYAVIDVADDGPGVPREVQGTLFEPFVTTKTNGTGLGLAISQQIIEEHRGDIHCEFLEKGTRFTIRLPLEGDAISVASRTT